MMYKEWIIKIMKVVTTSFGMSNNGEGMEFGHRERMAESEMTNRVLYMD